MQNIRSQRRDSGIVPVGQVPWGTSFCYFYQSWDDKLELLIPYLRSGLESGEYCLWVASERKAQGVDAVEKALKPVFRKFFKSAQIELVSSADYKAAGAEDIVLSRLDLAARRGFSGLRLVVGSQDASSSHPETGLIRECNAIAVYCYPQERTDAARVMEVIQGFEFAVLQSAGELSVMRSSQAEPVGAVLGAGDEVASLLSSMTEAFGYHRIVLDEAGKPCDYVFLEVNEAFEQLTGLKSENVIGKRVTEVMPGIEKDPADWINKYGQVALSGKPARFSSYASPLQRWYSVSAFSPRRGFFAVTFRDITEWRRQREELIRAKTEWERTFNSVPDLIAVLDPEHRVIRANKAMADRLGVTPEQCVGLHCYEVVHGSDCAPESCPHVLTRRDMKEHVAEVHEPRLGGDFLVSTTPLLDDEGHFIGSIHVARDITERKQMEMRQEREKERFRVLSEATSVLLTTQSPEAIIQTIASRVMEYLGCDVFVNYIFDEMRGQLRLNASAGVPEGLLPQLEWLDIGSAVCGCVARDGCRIVSEDVQHNGDERAALVRSFGVQAYACHPLRVGDRTVGTLSFGSTTRTTFADDELELMKTVADEVSVAMHRKQAEQSVEESERRLSRSQELAHLGSWELDLKTGSLTWSDEVYRIFGVEPQAFQATYEAFLQSVHPDDREMVNEAYVGSIRDGRDAYELEHRVVRRGTGEVRYVHEKCEHIRDRSGKIVRSVGMVHDITERKIAEDNLRAERDFSETVVNSLPGIFYVFGQDGKFLRWNRNFEAVTGYSSQEFARLNPLDLFDGADREVIAGRIRQVFEEGVSTAEANLKCKDGDKVPYYFTGFRMMSGGVPYLVGMGIDITERVEAEEELRRSAAELAVSNRELEAFSYSVSHDLRAPLRSMQGFSDALLEDYSDKLDEDGKRYLRYVRESSELMARLIDDLLRLSRVTRSEMKLERVNVSEMSKSILASLAGADPGRKVETVVEDGIYAEADPSLLRLAMENLLGNAWKFTGKKESAKIEVGTAESRGKRVCFVRDNGVGFDMAYYDKLFSPFQRLHKATEFSGTGIGLATAQRIIRRHGGEVWAESKVNEGATFYFTLER